MRLDLESFEVVDVVEYRSKSRSYDQRPLINLPLTPNRKLSSESKKRDKKHPSKNSYVSRDISKYSKTLHRLNLYKRDGT